MRGEQRAWGRSPRGRGRGQRGRGQRGGREGGERIQDAALQIIGPGEQVHVAAVEGRTKSPGPRPKRQRAKRERRLQR